MEFKILKILVPGKYGSGTSSICRRFSENKFIIKRTSRIGIDFVRKVIHYKENQFTIQLWEQAHNERFNTISRMYYKYSKGFLLVFTPTLSSIEYIKNENEYIMSNTETKKNVRYFIESKSDLCEKREVSKEEAIALSKENGFKYFQCSAKTGDNVSEIIHCIMRDIIERDLLSINNKKYLVVHNRYKKCIIF